MFLFKKRTFPLGYRLEAIFFEHISDGLGIDGSREYWVDEFGSLDSIVQLSSSDLSDDYLLVLSKKLRRMPSPMVFLVQIKLLTDFMDSRLAQTSLGCNFMTRIPILEKGDDLRVLSRRDSFHDVVVR